MTGIPAPTTTTTGPGVSVTFTPVLNFCQKGGAYWMFEKILKEPFSTNAHIPSPSIQFLQQSSVPKVVGPHEETNEGANEGANEATLEETNNEGANEGANEATHKETNNEGPNEGANEATHEETNDEGANEGANEATDVMLQRSTFSLGRVSFDGISMCPHLGKKYPRGNIHKGKYITQEKAATTLKTFKRNQVPSLNIFGINLSDLRR